MNQSAELEAALRFNEQAIKLYEEGRYAEAVQLAERAFMIREKALGPDHPLVVQSLGNLAYLYYEGGDYARAEPLYRRSLASREKALGPNHPLVAMSLDNLAGLYRAKGDYARAEELLVRALSIVEKALGPDHTYVAHSLNSLALLYHSTGDYARAEPLYRRALSIDEKALGPEHPDVATDLNNLGGLYHSKGDYARSEPLQLRSLAIREKVLGPDHPGVAMSLNNLAGLYRAKGDFPRVEAFLRRALAIRERALGPDHPLVATTLNNLAELYHAKGDFARAEPLYQRSLAIAEKLFGPDHPDVAMSLNNIAVLYKAKGDYARAEQFISRALSINEKALGPEHPGVATSLNNLAELYHAKGDYARAEPLYQRALGILKKALGPDHPLVAGSLNNMGELYRAKGDFARAEQFYQNSLATREKALGPDHPDVAQSLNNLALLYYEGSDFARAESLNLRALPILEKALGPDHPDVAQSLNNLALLYYEGGDFARAEPLYQRALAIAEKALGPGHPLVGLSLNNLGLMYYAQGDYARAEQFHRRALPTLEAALGPDHPTVAQSLGNLAVLYYAKGDYAPTEQFLSRGSEVRERNLSLILATGSERQKLAYIFTLYGETFGIVSFHTRFAPSAPQALQLSLTTILRRKGRALDAMTDQVAALRRRLDPQDRELLDQLSAAQSELSTLVLGGPGNTPPEEHGAAVSRLEERVEQFQDAISRRSAEFKAQTQPVTIEQVRQALPPGAALVEFFAYQPLDQKARTREGRFGLPRYVVYVLRKEGAPLWAELGEAESVDADLARLLTALRCPQAVNDIEECPAVTEVKRLARAVDERVMRPVRKLLGDTRQVFVSPDGALNLVPFGALVDESGKYMVETYSLTYLTSGRDLLRLQLSSQSRQPPLVVADPLFGPARSAVGGASPGANEGGGRRSVGLGQLYFKPLPGTAEEAKALAKTLPGARVLVQAQATEAALKQVSSPGVLHVATHGFFLPDQPQDAAAGGARGLGFMSDGGPAATVRIENPLLRSGLALEGANRRQGAGGEDGILTALEASALDLRGTKLVVLSACETGVGELLTGEGVYGLRRALVLAGSESQVMSLWQVSDEATRDLMVSYYKRLLAGEGRTEALRQVQLEMLRSAPDGQGRPAPLLGSEAARARASRSHPYFWAAFIQSGDWRGMSTQGGGIR